MFRRFRLLMLLVLPLLIAACASTRENAPGSEVSVRVENNLIPPTTLSVYAVAESGSRQLLGVVRPSQNSTLTFNPSFGGQFRFVAETTGGREIVSNTITLGEGDGAVWNINSNIIVPM